MELSICKRSISPKNSQVPQPTCYWTVHGSWGTWLPQNTCVQIHQFLPFSQNWYLGKHLNKEPGRGKKQRVIRLCPAATPFPSLKLTLQQQLNDLNNNRQDLTCRRIKAVHLWAWSVYLLLARKNWLIVIGGLSEAISRKFNIRLSLCQRRPLFRDEFPVWNLGATTQPAWCFSTIWVSATWDKPRSNCWQGILSMSTPMCLTLAPLRATRILPG